MNMLKISEAASLAMHATAYLATNQNQVVSAKRMASAFGASEHHLLKALQRLVKVGIVKSVRGPKGGFVLGNDPEHITLLDVYEAIDGNLPAGECLLGSHNCGGSDCMLGDLIKKVNSEVKNHLAGAKISELNGLFVSSENAGDECENVNSTCAECAGRVA